MIFQPDNTEEILDRAIGGFRQYILEDPITLPFVSQNLCDTVGYTKEELADKKADSHDSYARLVHPADRQIYYDLLHEVTEERPATAQYRIVKKDTTVVYVSDTVTAKRLQNGKLAGYAVLTDITDLKTQNDNLRFLNETVPCGMLKYTCDKHPKITYINEQMMKILRFPKVKEGELDYLELYKDNVYLMISMEERHKFASFLHQVYTQGAPLAGEVSVNRCDGTRARLYGWVTKGINEQGKEEFQSVCMDVTERYRSKRANETDRYLKALSDVYDKIFEYDFANKTVKYIYGYSSDTFGRIRNIPMQLEEATDQWIENTVYKDDRPLMHDFFDGVFERQFSQMSNRPPQVRFRSLTASGKLTKYIGIFLKLDAAVSLFCCRNTPDEEETDSIKSENVSLKSINENMQEMLMRFTDGIVAFEVVQDRVTPLYASDNICDFFGFEKEEWIAMMKKSNTIKELVSRSGVHDEKISELLTTGEAEFTYWDSKTGSHRRMKAICSQKHADGVSPRYIMLYSADTPNKTSTKSTNRIYIRTFGYFDVFVEQKPIAFRNKKSKELFALLVDRRGGYVSSEEAIGFLWEDEAVNAVTLARYRKVALRLKNTLEEYGITDIIESVDGKRRIVIDKVQCDLYDYLSRKEEYASLFKGSYLTNYSWGETTLGELLNENIY